MAHIFIPDDIYLYIAEYLDLSDCLSFAISGVSPRFIEFLIRRNGFDFSLCYGLKETLCMKYLCLSQQVEAVWSLNLSNCYWFSAGSLSESISKLTNLHELNVLGSALSLSSIVSKILPNCNLVRLHVPIVEDTWEDFKAQAGKITALHQEKLKNIAYLELYMPSYNSPNIFLLVFNFLRFCVGCKELDLRFRPSNVARKRDPLEHQHISNRIIQQCRKEMYEKLTWMESLKVVSIKSERNEKCLDDWCHWFVNETNHTLLEQLWLHGVETVTLPDYYQTMGRLRALCLERFEGSRLSTSALELMTHLGGVVLPLSSPVPPLRFIQAYCSSYADLDVFCRHHPKLEHFYIDSHACNAKEDLRISFDERWELGELRNLTYVSNNPHPDVLEQFIRSCPYLEELHISRSLMVSIFMSDEEVRDDAYWSISRLKRLRKLTISGIEFARGTFLRQVLTGCSQLEVLHINASFEEELTFHEDLCKFLPLAKELRDFRYQREEISKNMLVGLLLALGQCKKLQRIVIHQDGWSNPLEHDVGFAILDLMSVVLKNLQLFCLFYPVELKFFEDLNNQAKVRILPARPSFYFYIGGDLARESTVPRVHFDEIIKINPLSFNFPRPRCDLL